MITIKCHICTKKAQKTQRDFDSSKSGFHFCGKSCAAKYNNSIHKVKHQERQHKQCLNCDNLTSKKATKELFCSYLCKIEHNMKNTTIADCSPRTDGAKYNNIRSSARSYSKYFLDPKCYKCGYDKHFEVCHIKDISSFPKETKLFEVNAKNNLIHLCPNCHWEFDHFCEDKQLFLMAQKTGFEPVTLD